MAQPQPGSWPATPVLPAQQRHLVSRFSFGVTPQLTRTVRSAGGARAWLEQQLRQRPRDYADWWPDLHRTPASLWKRQTDQVRGGWEVMDDYANRLLVRRMISPQQLLEVMTDFWENHLYVPAEGDAQFVWRAAYGDLIRAHALGRFDEMLQAAATHPAMTIYLSTYASTKEHPDQNLGRELLELHTVGVGHYDQDDVVASSRILTGFRIDMWNTFAPSYDPDVHWRGPARVMGFHSPNRAADGRPVVRAYLHYLAHHPATATHLATKLATKFVSDTPPASLVRRLATTYLSHRTAIVPVLRELVSSAEFKASVGAKVRDPAEDLVATYRAVQASVGRPKSASSAANALIWEADQIGLAPMTWPRPDGAPVDSRAWATPGRLLGSTAVHWNAAGGWWPSAEVTYRSPASWLPAPSVSFRDLVDHLTRTLLGRVSTATHLQAACLATGHQPDDVVTAASDIVAWKMPRLLVTLLDTPEHYTR